GAKWDDLALHLNRTRDPLVSPADPSLAQGDSRRLRTVLAHLHLGPEFLEFLLGSATLCQLRILSCLCRGDAVLVLRCVASETGDDRTSSEETSLRSRSGPRLTRLALRLVSPRDVRANSML